MTERTLRFYRRLIAIGAAFAAFLLFGLLFLLFNRTENTQGTRTRMGLEAMNGDSMLENARALSELSGSIADHAIPALVRITVSRAVGLGRDKELESFFGQLPLAKGTDIGSGFFFRQGGWILTNYHVVRAAETIQVDGRQGQNWLAKMHAYDALSDLAVLKVEEPMTSILEWGDCNHLKLGHFVWVAGAPFGLEGTFSFGIISSLGRTSMSNSPLRDYLQTDAAINPGSSGGPMLDIDGKVVGIVSSILGDDYRGIGFALRADVAQSVVEQLVEHRSVRRGWIGVQLGQVTLEQAKKANLSGTNGALIEWIDAGEASRIPAKKAGLLEGDICVRCNDMKITSQFDLARKIGMTPPGSSLRMELIRNTHTVVVSLIVMEKH